MTRSCRLTFHPRELRSDQEFFMVPALNPMCLMIAESSIAVPRMQIIR